MNTVQLTDEELQTARKGMLAFLMDFSHDEADTVSAIRGVLAKLDAAEAAEDGTPVG